MSFLLVFLLLQAPNNRLTVMEGVYADDQAATGEKEYLDNCSGCHGETLTGGSAPRLRTDAFIDRWREDNLRSLFEFVKSTMPRGSPGGLSDDSYVNILAHILKSNSYPAGAARLTTEALPNIQLIHKDGPRPLPNNSLVLVVGCMTQASDGTWTLTNATEPVRNRQGTETTPEELQHAESVPLGNQTFRLQNMDTLDPPFNPDPHKGNRMQFKGALFRQTNNTSRIIVTSAKSVAPACGQTDIK